MVQSPTRSCEYITHSINQFLLNMRVKVQNLSDEDFHTQRDSVLTKLQEKDLNLNQQHSRNFTEIASHKYNFERQDQQIEAIKDITKQEFVSHFEKTFFSAESKRLDLQLMAKLHTDEQTEYTAKNKDHTIFDKLTRTKHGSSSLTDFKNSQGLHPDVYKKYFAEFAYSGGK